MTVSFSFLPKAFFLSTVTGHQTSDNTKTVAPWLKGQSCPRLLVTETPVIPKDAPSTDLVSCSKRSCWVVFLCHPLPRRSTTAGLAVEECFVLALPAWASLFRLGMRKHGKMFLYHSEPTSGLGTRRRILLAVKCRKGYNFSASTYLGVLQYPATEAALQQVVLSTVAQGNLPAVTQGWRLRHGS